MRVHVGDPAATSDLGAFLRSRLGALVDQPRPGELEVSLIGSYGDTAMRDQIELAVRRWSFVRQRPDSLVRLD